MAVNTQPSWHRLPVRNVSIPTSASREDSNNPNEQHGADTATIPPSTIPTPVFKSISVVDADSLTTTSHSPIPTYTGSDQNLLQGYCKTPDYTLLEAGETVYWVPVVGCISSKSDCCAQKTGSGAQETGGGNGNGAGISFPVSEFPAQATLDACPADYHSVGTGCCPDSYWPWSTHFGGHQTPCYSSLSSAITPPPIPDTLASYSTSRTPGASNPANAGTQKETSAIVNIAYALQYPVHPPNKPALEKKAKIGVGVGAAGAAIIIGVLLWLLVRKWAEHKRTRGELQRSSVGERFADGVDMSTATGGHHHLVAGGGYGVPEPPTERRFGGAKYSGVSTRG